MFTSWLRPTFFLLLTLALACLVGISYWEYLYQTGSGPGRNEFREGWTYILVYSWPVFLALAAITVAKRKQLSRWELSVAMLILVCLTAFIGIVWF